MEEKRNILGLTQTETKLAFERALRELKIEWAISDGKHEQRTWRKFWMSCICNSPYG